MDFCDKDVDLLVLVASERFKINRSSIWRDYWDTVYEEYKERIDIHEEHATDWIPCGRCLCRNCFKKINRECLHCRDCVNWNFVFGVSECRLSEPAGDCKWVACFGGPALLYDCGKAVCSFHDGNNCEECYEEWTHNLQELE